MPHQQRQQPRNEIGSVNKMTIRIKLNVQKTNRNRILLCWKQRKQKKQIKMYDSTTLNKIIFCVLFFLPSEIRNRLLFYFWRSLFMVPKGRTTIEVEQAEKKETR